MEYFNVSKDFSSNNFTDAELKVEVDSIVDKMTGNVNFPEPVPALAEVTTANTAYGDALEKAQDGSKADTVVKNNKKEAVITLIKKLADYVQNVSNGDEAMILSSGFSTHKKPSGVGPLPKAMNLHIEMGSNQGSVVASCKVIKKAKVYVFEYTPAPVAIDSDWHKMVSTKHKILINGLTSGQQYTFRVAGAGSDETRNWSDQITSFVL